MFGGGGGCGGVSVMLWCDLLLLVTGGVDVPAAVPASVVPTRSPSAAVLLARPACCSPGEPLSSPLPLSTLTVVSTSNLPKFLT